jgi:ATP-dependent RNA helicase MSS116, mitochondrial
MQNILQDPSLINRPSYGRTRSNPANIRAIIISPTRELAEQIAVEAQKLASSTRVIVQTAVGGTQKREGLRRIQQQGCHVLVGTPGRLKDVLSDPTSGVEAPKLSMLVLDEADRLLDEGFAPDIMEIQSYFPDPLKVDRQTLMFSATVPREVMKMVRQTMKPNFKFVKTVSDNEVPTHLSVPQKAVFLHGFENALPAVLELVKNYIAKAKEDPSLRPFRGIVYFNATAQVTLAYEAFQELSRDLNDYRGGHPSRMSIYQIHSRLSQAARTRSSDRFRKTGSAILFSSDVTARGMDFPDVTHIIQVGSPRERVSYIHRLGRTARANKTGEGWIFLHKGEYRDFQDKVGDLPILEDASSLQTASVDMSVENQQLPASTAETLSQIAAAMKLVPYTTKVEAYRASIGVLLGVFLRKKDLIRALNELAVFGYCMPEPPVLNADVARRMNIDLVPGVNVTSGRNPDTDLTPDNRLRFNSRDRRDINRFGDSERQQFRRPQFDKRHGRFSWDRNRNRNDEQYRR